MRRLYALLCVLSICFFFGGCNVQRVSQEQSRSNFDHYEEQMRGALASYGLTLDAQTSEDTAFGLYRSFSVALDGGAIISVSFSSNATKESRGREEFEIIYHIGGEKTFDMELFTGMVNAVSGMELSASACETFLSDPEEEHSPARYGLKKTDDQMIWKYDFLNNGEDWSLGYSLYKAETEELTFWGITKQGTRDNGTVLLS